MRAPIEGGIPEEIYASEGIAWPQCSLSKGCIVYDQRGDKAIISPLDPIRGKGAELVALPSSGGAYILPDGTEFACSVAQDSPRNHIRIISFDGKRSRDLIVKSATSWTTLTRCRTAADAISQSHG
jgi:hypothetical protein